MSALDGMVSGRLQLGVLAYLSTRGAVAFADLAAALQTTNGTLSVQLRRLEETGHVVLERGFLGRRPRTSVAITSAGRAAYERHLDALLRAAEGRP